MFRTQGGDRQEGRAAVTEVPPQAGRAAPLGPVAEQAEKQERAAPSSPLARRSSPRKTCSGKGLEPTGADFEGEEFWGEK